MHYYGSTDQGIRRNSNQDAFRINIAGNLLVATVCDGMGGVNGGNIASQIGILHQKAIQIHSFCFELRLFGRHSRIRSTL